MQIWATLIVYLVVAPDGDTSLDNRETDWLMMAESKQTAFSLLQGGGMIERGKAKRA